jgi:hypothetical protein
MPSIFLSYRRVDTSGHTGRLSDALEAKFGHDAVFHDIESIEAGKRFDEVIDAALAKCRVFIPLIGDDWLGITGADGRRRLDDSADLVRREVAAALRRGVPVIPVLLEGATMPAAASLPEEMQALTRHQAIEISDTRWDFDVQRLITAIERVGVAATGGSDQPSRRYVLWGLAAVGAAAAGGAAWWRSSRPDLPVIDGLWMLPSGSYWTVVQTGREVVIDETHYQSREVWRRGTGRLADDGTLHAELLPVFDPPERLRLEYRLRLSADGRRLGGDVRDLVSGRSDVVTLLRRSPDRQ